MPINTDNVWNREAEVSLDRALECVWSCGPKDRFQSQTDACVKAIVKYVPENVRRLLDVGAGCGRLTVPIAKLYPQCDVVGYDFAPAMLARLKESAVGLSNVRASSELGEVGPVSFAWSVVVLQHNEPHVVSNIIAAVAKQLEPGGVFLYQLVENVEINDWGHVPEAVARAWATDVGLTVDSVFRGMYDGDNNLCGDWIWVVARKA